MRAPPDGPARNGGAAMAEPKTRPTGVSVTTFIAGIAPEERRADCRKLHKLMREVTGSPAKMWGPSIVGYGSYLMKYANGRELDWPRTGFSPRKQNLTIYVSGGLAPHAELLARLGRHTKGGGGCLYLKRLADVDLSVLATLLKRSLPPTARRAAR